MSACSAASWFDVPTSEDEPSSISMSSEAVVTARSMEREPINTLYPAFAQRYASPLPSLPVPPRIPMVTINDFLVKEQKSSTIKSSSTNERHETDLSALLGDSVKVKKDSTTNNAQGLDSLQNLNISPLFSLSIPSGTFRYVV
jgi:hypothetical protein